MNFNTAPEGKWHKWFALIPTRIAENPDGSYKMIWLEWYEWRSPNVRVSWGYIIERRSIGGDKATYAYHGGSPD